MTLAPIEVAAAASSHTPAVAAHLPAEIVSSTLAAIADTEVPLETIASQGPGYLATLTLVNTSSTAAQAAGQPTPVFGWCFKDGDVQPGTAPLFTVGTTTQPYSAGLQTYWPSGCLKFAGFMLLPSFSLPASSSQAVTMSKGGAWPSSSGRTLAEVYSQNLVVNALLYNSTQNGRGGAMTLKSWLNGDVNQFKTVKWLDGAAGTGWRISTHMAQTQGGTIDGMLACDHYVLALNNMSGGLGGFRWLGAMRQPFYNQSGQSNNAPGSYIFFVPPSVSNPATGLNWSIQPGGSGPVTTTPLPWLGHDNNTFDAANFTCAGSTATCVVAASGTDNYYMGAGGSSFLPVAFSNLPSGSQGSGWGTNVENGGFAFLYTDPTNSTTQQTQFELFQWGQQNYSSQYNFTSAFTGTVTPCPCLPPFFRLFFATKDASYNFFQGTGSLGTDTTLHCQIDQEYWVRSGVIPPFNRSVNGGSAFGGGGAITEIMFTYNWFPYSVGNMTVQEPGTGDHNDIGILPVFASNDFYNQTPGTLRHNRIIGLSCAFSVLDFVDAPSLTRLNLGNTSGPGGAGGYGLAAPSSPGINCNFSFGLNGGGFSQPSTTALGYALSLGEHEPAWPVWAYLRTGELQYLDLIVDQMQMEQLSVGSSRTINSGNAGIGATLYGGNFGSDEMRSLAWSSRDSQWAAHLYPRDPTNTSANPIFSDSTNLGQYLWDSAEACITWPLLQFQSSPSTIPWTSWSTANGFWFPWFAYNQGYFNQPAFGVSGGAWEYADFIQTMCLAVARGSVNAKIFIESCPVKQWAHDLAVLGGWLYIGDSNRYAYPVAATDSSADYANALITQDAQYGYSPFSLFANISAGHNYITWAPNNTSGTYTTPAFTMTTGYGGGKLFGWQPENGDIYIPSTYAFASPNDVVPPELSTGVTYYAVNVAALAEPNGGGSNYVFDLAATPGGPAILINSTTPGNSSLGFRLQPSYKPPTHTVYTDIYLGNFWFAVCWATALGIIGFGSLSDTTTVLGDLHNRMANSSAESGGIDVTGWFYDVVGEVVDTRYCMQPSFA